MRSTWRSGEEQVVHGGEVRSAWRSGEEQVEHGGEVRSRESMVER